MPSGISVAGPKGVELASAITPGVQEVRVQRAVPRVVLNAPSAIRPAILANATTIPREANNPAVAARRPTDAVFGAKRVYQMQINLPNLTSAGGSWIIRFAEMARSADTSELSTPVATMQVDPAYPQTLQSDGVQGTVVLYAVIHADGTVGDVRVLHGVHERLDDNAMKALSRWKFRPATKSGSPVEIEAVVQIPFYARRAALR
jgi:protein TonB